MLVQDEPPPCSVVVELQKDVNGNVYTDKDGRKYYTIKWLNPSRMGRRVGGASTKKIASLFGGPTQHNGWNIKLGANDDGQLGVTNSGFEGTSQTGSATAIPVSCKA